MQLGGNRRNKYSVVKKKKKENKNISRLRLVIDPVVREELHRLGLLEDEEEVFEDRWLNLFVSDD